MIRQGCIHWVDFGTRQGSRPMGRRPALVLMSDAFASEHWRTVIVAPITSNIALTRVPGNVLIPEGVAGLTTTSVVNLTAITTVHKSECSEPVGELPWDLWQDVARGIERVFHSERTPAS